LMRSLAVEFGGQNIRANCIAPGGTPLGRRGTVDEIAGTVRLLVGPEGAYITGQTIHVNGGVYLT